MNRTDGLGPSVKPSSLLQPPAVREDPARQRTQAVATRGIRASSNVDRRVETAFPISDFQQAVLIFDFPKIKKLLKDAGLSDVDVNFIESRTKMICGEYLKLDVLLDVLLNTAIQKSFLTYLPGLPNYIAKDMQKIVDMADKATTQFCNKRNRESFDVFCAFLKRYRPTNAETCLRKVYPLVSADPVFGPVMRRSFPEFKFQVSIQGEDEFKAESDASLSSAHRGEKPRNFPISEFRMALTNLSSDELCRILVAHGWDRDDFDVTKQHMDLLYSERSAWRRPDMEQAPLECLDEVAYNLLMVGIENKKARPSLLKFLHVLPTFNGFNAENYNKYLCDHIVKHLRDEPDDESLFNLFVNIMIRVQPENRAEYIESAMSRLSIEKQQELSRKFPL